ncbi:MAG: Flp pilus assembly complex ATPase component TadA [Candidatus Sungbacteria bacterium]|uniref:Flp pilus assembly complex ATPase component TadA n=1 Tax=Candidatus Sungiibacteriota bacterium TaxID=2750080 RepID=A0A932YWZ3_9BACT|nr:Flp pilus assembly complex ATPase component TadA [Candidatus Sungbacteria bacterium]
MRIADSQLKSFIADGELIAPRELERAEAEAKKSGKTLHEVILNLGLMPETDLRKLEAYILGIPFIDLTGETIDPAVLHIIPESIARKSNIIAFKKSGQELQVAMLDPADIQTIEFIKKTANLKILPRLTNPQSIKAALRQYQKSLEAEFGEIIKKEAAGLRVISPADAVGAEGVEDLKKMAEDLPIIKIVDTLIRHAILQSASDIHIEPSEKEVMVRYRIDGILHDAMTLPKQVAAGVVARIKVMSNLKLDEHRLPQDGRFKVESPDYRISFRVSVLPVFDGEKVVMRLLPETAQGFTLERLGFRPDQLDLIHRHIRKTTGIVLATGPTGSGKTTTLYTVIDILNKPGVNISTIEDPVEYRIPRINQTQVRPELGLSFANGLRSLLRQDPDIVMVGEIRDNETAGLAINAALTGHLVLSTLHTNSAAGALPRLLDMKVEPFLIASTVNLIMAQRLVRTLCDVKEEYTLSSAEIKSLSSQVDLERILGILKREKVVGAGATLDKINWARPRKSEKCPDGYKGRIGIHEALEVTETIKELIVKNATSDEIERQARSEGMVTMLEDGFIKAAQGITSIEEILRVTSE